MMKTSPGPIVDIGPFAIQLPSGWSVTEVGQVVMCGVHDLKQRVALVHASGPPVEGRPGTGQRTEFKGRLFSGHLVQAVVAPGWFGRTFFGSKPHCRFEWVIQSGAACIAAVYLAELEEDRSHIKSRVEELLDALELT